MLHVLLLPSSFKSCDETMAKRSTFIVFVFCVFIQVTHLITRVSGTTVSATNASTMSTLSFSSTSDSTLAVSSSTLTSSVSESALTSAESTSSTTTTVTSASTSTTSTSTTTTTTTPMPTTTTTTTPMPTTTTPELLPPQPTNLMVVNKSADFLTITWQSTENVSCDVIYTKTESGIINSSCSNVTTMMCKITSLEAGTSYNISVIARLESKSNTSKPLTDVTKPIITSACGTSDFTESSMTLSWPAARSNLPVTYFYNYNTNTVNSSNVNSTVVQGLSAGFHYSFKVWASISDTNPTDSEAVSCTGTTVPLVTNSSCSSSEEKSSSLTLSWHDALAQLPLSYEIQYEGNIANRTNSTRIPINNLVPGTLYNFTILVFITGNPNLRSRTDITCTGSTGPTAPTGISVSNITDTSLAISWNVGSTNKIDSSSVSYTCGSRNNSVPPSSSNSASLRGLQPGCNYTLCVSVTSYNKNASSCVWNVTNPSLSGTCNFSSVTSKSMIVLWSNASSDLGVDYPVSYSSSDTPSSNMTAVTPILNFTNLTPGTFYSFQIWARIKTYQTAQSSPPLSCSKPTEPDIPTITTPISTNWSSLSLAWSVGGTKTVNGTSVNYTCNARTDVKNNTGNPVQLNDLKPGCNYTVCVAVQSYGNEASSCGSAITNPYINDSCFCTERTNSSLHVTWPLAQSAMTVTYNLTYANSKFQTNETSYNVPNLKAGESYTFIVFAQLLDKQSPPVSCRCHTVPNTPSGLTVQALNETSFSASWIKDTNASQISYNVTYYKYGENQIRLTSCVSSMCVINVFGGDLAGSSYNVCLRSISNMVPSAEECQCVTTYSYPPSNVTTATSDKSVTLTIISNPKNIDTTELCYIASLTSSGEIYYNSTSKTDFGKTAIYFGDLTPASNYSFSVRSSAKGSCSVGSSAVCDITRQSFTSFFGSATTQEAAPSAVQNLLVVSDNGAGDIILSWISPTAPNGVLQYYYVHTKRLSKASGGNAGMEEHIFPFEASLSNDVRQYNISGLRAGYFYIIEVFASTKIGNGTKANMTYKTKQTYPVLKQPQNFTLHQLGNRAINFEQLSAVFSNIFSNITGDIVNYTLVVTTVPTFNTSTNIQSILDKQNPEAYAAKVSNDKFFCDNTNDCSLEIGTGSNCDNAKVCDAKLNPETTYYFFIVACNSEYCSGSSISQAGRTDKNWPLLIMQICLGVIIPIAVISIIVLVILVACFIRKRAGPKRSTATGRVSAAFTTTGHSELETSCIGRPIQVEKFLERVAELEKDSGLLYSDEYEELKPVGKEQSCSSSELEQNRTKNRYGNIKPYDITRVKLLPIEDEEGSDYINANWMPGFNSKREFIAAQGPLPCTKDDFWRMVWEYNCRGIVMLTGCVEGGKIKCDQYWPHDMEPVVYGDLQVTKTKEETTSPWVVRELNICMGQQQRSISQIHLPSWEDNTGPGDAANFLQFVRFVREKLSKRGGPVVVHCSAGVGRTGTFIATDTLLQQLDRQNFLDVFEVVYKLRLNRVCMVQTESQYISLYRCLAYEIENRSPPAEEETMEDMYANFNGGPDKREDDIYANAGGVQNKEVIEMNGNFYHPGPESSSRSISRQ